MYLKSTSGTSWLVFPSKTTNFGAELYPLPKEEIPIESNDAKGSTFAIWGRETLGLIVWSQGKSNPISLILVLFILPIDWLCTSNNAWDPSDELIEDTEGNV